MDKHYADTVRLLLNIAPEVFDNDVFAMKGGTAINLFLRDMPRLSVDIDVVYLAGHNRPTHEVLFGNDKDIASEYARTFVGMTEVACPLETLLDTRARLRHELPRRLHAAHRQFLRGMVRAEPDWSLLQCPHAAELPALRWKIVNLETFRKRRPRDFATQANALDAGLSPF